MCTVASEAWISKMVSKAMPMRSHRFVRKRATMTYKPLPVLFFVLKLSLGSAVAQDLEYVTGPFQGYGSMVARTDVREHGCNTCAPTMRILAAPDLDGDGNSELILSLESFTKEDKASDIPLPIFFFRTNGERYDGITELPKRIHAREAVTADFNSDGRDDVFIAAHGMDRKPFPGEQNVLLLSQPNGSHKDVSSTHLPQMEDMAHGVAAGDIDSDGDVDLFIVTNAGGGLAKVSNYFLLNDGAGSMTFSSGKKHLPSGAPRKDDYFLTARIEDITGDEVPDLIMAGEAYNGSPSLVLIGDGKGNFESFTKLPRSAFGKQTFTTDIDVVDLNGDELKDLVLLNTGQIDGRVFKGVNVQTLVQTAVGQFEDQTEQRMWDQRAAADSDVNISHNVNFVDLDQDGDLDFVVQSLNPSWRERVGDVPPHIGLNDGNGKFSPVAPTWLTFSAYSFEQLLPIKISGKWKIAGISQNGVEEPNGFWAVGHKLYLYQ
jgi:hypothetical protein